MPDITAPGWALIRVNTNLLDKGAPPEEVVTLKRVFTAEAAANQCYSDMQETYSDPAVAASKVAAYHYVRPVTIVSPGPADPARPPTPEEVRVETVIAVLATMLAAGADDLADNFLWMYEVRAEPYASVLLAALVVVRPAAPRLLGYVAFYARVEAKLTEQLGEAEAARLLAGLEA